MYIKPILSILNDIFEQGCQVDIHTLFALYASLPHVSALNVYVKCGAFSNISLFPLSLYTLCILGVS